jgi:3-hydroxyisobutyrate dehydrogenase-like beta-hydroxyacid dehydrogenase
MREDLKTIVSVLGLGTMGHGIAQALPAKGFTFMVLMSHHMLATNCLSAFGTT